MQSKFRIGLRSEGGWARQTDVAAIPAKANGSGLMAQPTLLRWGGCRWEGRVYKLRARKLRWTFAQAWQYESRDHSFGQGWKRCASVDQDFQPGLLSLAQSESNIVAALQNAPFTNVCPHPVHQEKWLLERLQKFSWGCQNTWFTTLGSGGPCHPALTSPGPGGEARW